MEFKNKSNRQKQRKNNNEENTLKMWNEQASKQATDRHRANERASTKKELKGRAQQM